MTNLGTPNELSAVEEMAKTHVIIAYAIMLAGFFSGIPWIIGIIWAFVKKADATGTIFEDHYSNIIATFGWGLVFSIIGWILTFVFVGFFILFAVWLWAVYRVTKGLIRATSNQSYQ